MTVSRAATHHDLDVVVDIMTSAFAEDPVWGGWAFPDPDRQRAAEQRRAFWRVLIRSGLRFPWVRIAEGAKAAALWVPVGESELTLEEEEELEPQMRELLGDRCDVFMEGLQSFQAAIPEAPHFHLDLIGTHASHRGRGIGMALLRENLTMIDADTCPPTWSPRTPRTSNGIWAWGS